MSRPQRVTFTDEHGEPGKVLAESLSLSDTSWLGVEMNTSELLGLSDARVLAPEKVFAEALAVADDPTVDLAVFARPVILMDDD